MANKMIWGGEFLPTSPQPKNNTNKKVSNLFYCECQVSGKRVRKDWFEAAIIGASGMTCFVVVTAFVYLAALFAPLGDDVVINTKAALAIEGCQELYGDERRDCFRVISGNYGRD